MAALFGNNIWPSGNGLYWLDYFLLITGALINAFIFGTIAVMASTFNKKLDKYQSQLDISNTAMKNMRLPE